MKVIFLDIDGVLNTDTDELLVKSNNLDLVPIDWGKFEGTARNPEYPSLTRYRTIARHDIDYAKLKLLAYVVKHSGAKIVLSSSWRMTYSESEMDFIFGWVYRDWPKDTVIDCTPFGPYDSRDFHIAEWINQNPNVEEGDYVILDDRDVFHGQRLRRFINTDPTFGLTPIEACLALKMLGIDILNLEERISLPDFRSFPVKQYLMNMMAACELDWLDKAKIMEHFRQPSGWPKRSQQLTNIYNNGNTRST